MLQRRKRPAQRAGDRGGLRIGAHRARRECERRIVTATSSRRAAVTAQVQHLGVVAVIRLKDPKRLRAVVDALSEGGVRALEVTMTVPGAFALIRELAPRLPDGFLLGAGRVTDAATARAVIDAGASFVVGPIFRPDVIAACHERDVPAMPGCYTPTEIFT